MSVSSRSGVGIGQLLLRISQFNECQAKRPAENQMHFWREFVDEFFFNRATYKYIVWLTDHETRSFQLFQLGTETLPRFYNVIYSSSISSVYYVLENPREYCLDSCTYLLFSPKTRVEYKYDNGCRVITKGFLRVTFSQELKIILWEFEAKCHEEYLPTSIFREKRIKRATQRTSLNINNNAEDNSHCTPSGGEISLDSLPKSHVNQFGLPPPVMRCFEITEVIHYMKDLIDFAMERQLAPLESLELYHKEIIDKPSQGGPPPQDHEVAYSGWNGGPHKGRTKSSFLQPNDDYRDDIDSMNVFGVNVGGMDVVENPNNSSNTPSATSSNPSNQNPKSIKTEKSDHPHSSTSDKKTTEEMDLNTVPLSEQALMEESKYDISQIEIKEEKNSFPGGQPPSSQSGNTSSAKVKEEKSGGGDKDGEKSSQNMEVSDGKASEKEDEDRLEEDDDDSGKPESGGSKNSSAAASKKRIKKPRPSSASSLQNISSIPQMIQRPKRKKK